MKIKVCSLFSGIGGMEWGIYDALGKDNVEIVFASEIDKYASKSYEILHNHEVHGDITKISKETIPNFDLLVGGSPCQSFSIAGKRGGFEDTRGTLFFQYAEVVKVKQPQVFLYENVKGLTNHDKGKTLETILNTFSDLGYKTFHKVVNTKLHGVPQNRERLFIIGFKNHEVEYEFPQDEPLERCIKDILEDSVDEKFYLSQVHHDRFVPKSYKNSDIKVVGNTSPTGHYARDCHDSEGISPALCAHDRFTPKLIVEGTIEVEGFHDKDKRVYNTEGLAPTIAVGGNKPQIFEEYILNEEKTNKVYENLKNKEAIEEGKLIDGYNGRVRADEKTIGTLTTECGSTSTRGGWKVIMSEKPFRLRRLTPLECFRLQSFPDEAYYTLKEAGISNTQLYKMAGNAVTSRVISKLIKNIYKER